MEIAVGSLISCLQTKVIELDAGVCGGKAPVDAPSSGVTRLLLGGDCRSEVLLAVYAFAQALAGKQREFNLGHFS